MRSGEPAGGESAASSSLSRKSTKIDFLSAENAQLKEELNEFQNMLRLNKEALRIAMGGLSGQKDAAGDFHNTSSSGGQANSSSTTTTKTLQLMMNSLHQENEALQRKIDRITEERNIALSKVPVAPQQSAITKRLG